jgi:hypothetical protein
LVETLDWLPRWLPRTGTKQSVRVTDGPDLSWWRTPRRWRRLSAEERIAFEEARFVRVRSRRGLLRHRRPGEFSIPGIKFSLAVGVVLGAMLSLAGVGVLWRNVLVVAFATLVVSWALALAAGLFFRPGPPPMEPPFGNSGDQVPR